ncbi:MAG TPA: hypothetical protein VN950_18990 [Terriglobales bacterium]|nr:hypothetical protein [Terriglobales bacterium]
MRRFTRLTKVFSKKLDNLKAALALHFAWYNFCRVHKSLRVTPCDGSALDESGLEHSRVAHDSLNKLRAGNLSG